MSNFLLYNKRLKKKVLIELLTILEKRFFHHFAKKKNIVILHFLSFNRSFLQHSTTHQQSILVRNLEMSAINMNK